MNVMDTSTSSQGDPYPLETSQRALVEQEMEECESSILALDAAKIDLVYKRFALKTKLNATSSFMAKFPDEVVGEIFDFVNESEDKDNTRAFPAPFLLGRICTAWRHIAWTRPRLWRFVSICLDTLNQIKISNQEQLLREWLLRSRNVHLHYFITFSSINLIAPESLVKLILSTCPRWKSFTANSIFPMSFKMTDGHRFPNLSTLKFTAARNQEPTYDFSAAPSLRELQILGYSRLSTVAVCWAQLVSVTMVTSLGDAFTLIKELKASQTIRLQIEGTMSQVISPIITILPNLFTLEIEASTSKIRKFLDVISTPALKCLKLIFASQSSQSWRTAIEDLYQRSPFSLSSLQLENSNAKEEAMISLLSRFRSLSSFSLSSGVFSLSDGMINQLNPSTKNKNDQNYFLPALVQFTYKGMIEFSYKAMVDMLEQRLLFSRNQETTHKISSLRNVDITYDNVSWNRDGDRSNPNYIQAFYRKIIDLESRGTTLKLVWEEKPRLGPQNDQHYGWN